MALELLAEDDAAMHHSCERLRIMETSQIIWPSFETLVPFKAASIRLICKDFEICAHYPTLSDVQVLEDFGEQLPSTRESFLAEREMLIAKYIEAPCQPLARKLMDHGKLTTLSNAYSGGLKGIWWSEDLLHTKTFFTSIITGQTYKVDRAETAPSKIYTPHSQEINFTDCMPNNDYLKQIGMPTKPKQAAVAQENLTCTRS